MLTRVEITNYRGFKSYQMDGLARVNLLVGKNNSGKTALLEGIQFLTSGGDPVVLAEVAQRRGEVISRSEAGKLESYVDIAHFFHGHAFSDETPFSISGNNDVMFVTVGTCPEKNGRPNPGTRAFEREGVPGVFLEISSGPGMTGDRNQAHFRISKEGGVSFDFSLHLRRRGESYFAHAPRARFLGSESPISIDLARMWDEVIITGQEADVAQAMRVLEPNLESVHFLTGVLASGSGSLPGQQGIVVRVKGQQGPPVPLGSMGDGMCRLMALASSLAFTKNGYLFLDEIDTGLHYSVMRDMWKLVITRADIGNTQVFATTHSWDCIEGLALLCQANPELMPLVAVHKIDRAIPRSVPFTGEAIVRMVKSDIDPR